MADQLDPDDPFAEFEDWLVDGPAGRWPSGWEYTIDQDARTPEQKRIATENAKLLLDRDGWKAAVERFEAALEGLGNAGAAADKRRDYEICFDGQVFKDGGKDFSGLSFPAATSFEYVRFGEGRVSFDDASFGEGDVSFYGARFGEGYVRFAEASFGEGDVNFYGTRFGEGDVSFEGARFGEGDVRFNEASFGEGNITFARAQLIGAKLWFVGLHVHGHLNCTSLKARGASFRSATVDGLCDLTDTIFKSIPDFRQMKLDRAPEVARMAVPPPDMAGRWPWSEATDQQDVLKFRRLKAMAVDANDHEKDGEFFAYEMMAKRGWETKTRAALLANTVYWTVSFYGQSYQRPLAWMTGTLGLFGYLYALMAFWSVGATNAAAFGFGTLLSLKSALPFLGSIVRFSPAPDEHVSWFQHQLNALEAGSIPFEWFTALSVIQSLLGLFFFFFLLLGLRNKFRLK